MNTATDQTETPAIFEKRENMGASPLAIEYAEIIANDISAALAGGGNGVPPRIAIAALIDAAIRKSGAPELLASTQALFEHCAMTHKHWGEGCNRREADAAQVAARAAIEYANRPTP